MKVKFQIPVYVLMFVLLSSFVSAQAEENSLLNYPGFSPGIQSQAYLAFKKKPVSELSKLIYLIDRFVDVEGDVLYENHYYPLPLVARIARLYLLSHYHNEDAEYWIKQWGSASYPSGNRIYARFSNQEAVLARELLLEELNLLNQTMNADKDFRK